MEVVRRSQVGGAELGGLADGLDVTCERRKKKKSRIIPNICLGQLEERKWSRGGEGAGKIENQGSVLDS